MYLYLPLLTFTYLYLPLLTFTYLYLNFIPYRLFIIADCNGYRFFVIMLLWT